MCFYFILTEGILGIKLLPHFLIPFSPFKEKNERKKGAGKARKGVTQSKTVLVLVSLIPPCNSDIASHQAQYSGVSLRTYRKTDLTRHSCYSSFQFTDS
jgi:hypothetical protein